MSTSIQCVSPILGTVLRVIHLDSCGAPVTGTSSAEIVMEGFVQVQSAPNYDTGDRKILRLANGSLCHNRKLPDVFTHFVLTADFCVWNPGLVVNTVGGRLLTATESPTGTGVAYGEGLTAKHASLEVWQEVDGIAACDASGNQRYLYHAWPHITNFKMGQSSVNNDPTQLQIIGETAKSSTLWTAGASWLGSGQIQSQDHYLWNSTTTTPPTSECVISDYP